MGDALTSGRGESINNYNNALVKLIDILNNKYIDYEYWIKISKQFENLRLLKPKNNTAIYKNLSPIIIKNYFKSTDVVYLSRVNREKIAVERYNIKKKIIDKDLSQFEKTLFITDDINSVNYIYHNLFNQIYIYKYKSFWLLSITKISHINSEDIFYSSKIPTIDLNEKNSIPIFNPNLPKFGFEYDDEKKKLILDGKYGVLNFKLKGANCIKDKKIHIEFEPFYNDSFKETDFEIDDLRNIQITIHTLIGKLIEKSNMYTQKSEILKEIDDAILDAY